MTVDAADALRRVSVVIPTLNEAESIGQVIDQLPKGLLEILIVDGASKDRTADIARARGARVINEPRKGYGRAYKTGFWEAKGEIIATLDGDLTYPAARVGELAGMLLEEDLDFITCDRLSTLKKEAMSGKHRFGNIVLSTAARVLFGVPVHDSQSGMWIFRRALLADLTLTADGMPFSEELKIEAFRARRGRCKEIAIEYRIRVGEAVLSTWRDGWRNLSFLFKKRFGRARGARGDLFAAPARGPA